MEKFLITHKENLYSSETVEECIDIIKKIARENKTLPKAIQPIEGINFEVFDYLKVRLSLRARGKVIIKYKDKSILKIVKQHIYIKVEKPKDQPNEI